MTKTTTQELPSTRPIHEAFVLAGFTFNRTVSQKDGTVLHGYSHADGRGAIYMEPDRWAVMVNGEQHVGTIKTIQDLPAVLGIKQRAAQPDVADRPAPPAHVVRAVEILGELTNKLYALDLLGGERRYKDRVVLLKKLFQTDKVLVKESTLPCLVAAFHTALGITNGRSATAKSADFAVRCAQIAASAKAKTKADAKALEAAKKNYLLITEKERAVTDGRPTLPPYKRTAHKQDAAIKEALKAEMTVLIASAEQPAVPHPEAAVTVVGADVRLLEDPGNGIVMMQVEKANSQGAICVYNNGSRVACGVVPNETLKTLRPIEKADLLKAANQLLNPIIPGVPVTPVAARHLTAVLHCKELIPVMATKAKEVTKSKKFAPPAGAPSKKAAPAIVERHKSEAARVGHAPLAGVAGRARIPDDAKITILVKDSPYREGSKAEDTFKLLKTCRTAGDFRAAAKTDPGKYDPSYLTWTTVPHGTQPALIKIG